MLSLNIFRCYCNVLCSEFHYHSLLFLRAWYCMVVSLAVDHIYFLCNGHSGVVVLFILVSWCNFLLLPPVMEFPGWDW